jgi:hypothetical protein
MTGVSPISGPPDLRKQVADRVVEPVAMERIGALERVARGKPGPFGNDVREPRRKLRRRPHARRFELFGARLALGRESFDAEPVVDAGGAGRRVRGLDDRRGRVDARLLGRRRGRKQLQEDDDERADERRAEHAVEERGLLPDLHRDSSNDRS